MKKRIVLLPTLILLVAWSFSWSDDPPEKLPPPKTKAIPAALRYLGSGSCAASSCHNSGGQPGNPGSEYTTWAAQPRDGQAHDPHGKAYSVLLERTSQQISRNLGRSKPPQEDSLCLNCHVMPNHDLAQKRGVVPEHFAADGVSCESCHGPAERWLTEHYRPSWRTKDREEKAALGMKDTRSLFGRATMCASCHVGSLPAEKRGMGQDVNHDLYAAGHPPLVFEFSAYHSSLLRHWRDEKDKNPRLGGTPDFEARAWVIGQLVSAESALDLLAHRAADNARPWPELAEMDCFSCHHALKGNQDRSELRASDEHKNPKEAIRKPGSLVFRTWYYQMLPRAIESTGGDAAPINESIQSLQKVMATLSPDREKAADHARAMRAHVKKALSIAEQKESFDLESLYSSIRIKDVPRVGTSWDHAAATFLSIGALENAWNDLNLPTTHANLPTTIEAIREELRFPRGFLSPARFDGVSIRKKFEQLR